MLSETPTTIPQDIETWFRRPTHKKCCSYGDTLRFLWVAEPILHEGCYGVGYEVNGSMCWDMVMLERIKAMALAELYRRVQAGDKHSEGSMIEDFAWKVELK